MNRLGIAFLTKDKTELSDQSVQPLLQPDVLDLWIIDGSVTPEGVKWPLNLMLAQPEREQGHKINAHQGIRGGPDVAIVYALTQMLKGEYQYIGIVEQDVLLDPNWYKPTMALFERGADEGLAVGAVSARSYEDRVLIQRDGYAVMHNLGSGMVIFSREAALLLLKNYRTGWWPDNRRVFMQLTGLDIGRWAAFRGAEQSITADWHFDVILSSHGLCSLALTPALATMIGQAMSLEDQGLRLTTEPFELLRNREAFDWFRWRTLALRDMQMFVHTGKAQYDVNSGTFMWYPHWVMAHLGQAIGPWRLKWSQGLGPFSWVADEEGAHLDLSVSGAVTLLVGGGPKGGKVMLRDTMTGYETSPHLLAEQTNSRASPLLQLVVPCGGVAYRSVRLTAMAPGVTFYGLMSRELQPLNLLTPFSYDSLPPVWGGLREDTACRV